MPTSHTNWFHTLLEHVVPTCAGKVAAAALARQLVDGARWNPMVLLLDKQGAAIAGSNYLPINIRGNAGWLTLTEARRGLLVVTERINQTPIVDVPVWYDLQWRGSRIKVEELGRWQNVNLGREIKGVSIDKRTIWVAPYYPGFMTKPTDYRDACLLVGRGVSQLVPSDLQLTDRLCTHVSTPIAFGDEVYVLVTARFERIELWAIDRKLNLREVCVLDRTKNNKKQSLGPAEMVRCGDSLIMMWTHYIDRVGEKKPRTWQGVLRATSYDLQSGSVSPIASVSKDVRVVAVTVQAHPLDKSVLVTWESRPKRGGGGMRAVRFGSIEDLPSEPVVLPEKSTRLFVPNVAGPILREGCGPEASSWGMAFDVPPLR